MRQSKKKKLRECARELFCSFGLGAPNATLQCCKMTVKNSCDSLFSVFVVVAKEMKEAKRSMLPIKARSVVAVKRKNQSERLPQESTPNIYRV